MTTLRRQSIRLSPRSREVLLWLFPLIAFGGFLDAAYLTTKHYTGGVVPCGLFGGCEQVLTSGYSELFGLPLALYGVIYYLGILVLALLYLDRRNDFIFHLVTRSTIIGLLSSAWFIYLQLGVIGALCIFCLVSALSSSLLFILGFILTADHISRRPRLGV